MKRRIRHHRHTYPELDITAFMNLMVILVPFLLITAVFSRVTVLDLYLPPAASDAQDTKNRFRLEVVLRQDEIVLAEAVTGLKKRFKKTQGSFDLNGLKESLYQLKQKFPGKQEATILAEPEVKYDTLVQVMDAIRLREEKQGSQLRLVDLFPAVSIGDAPMKTEKR